MARWATTPTADGTPAVRRPGGAGGAGPLVDRARGGSAAALPVGLAVLPGPHAPGRGVDVQAPHHRGLRARVLRAPRPAGGRRPAPDGRRGHRRRAGWPSTPSVTRSSRRSTADPARSSGRSSPAEGSDFRETAETSDKSLLPGGTGSPGDGSVPEITPVNVAIGCRVVTPFRNSPAAQRAAPRPLTGALESRGSLFPRRAPTPLQEEPRDGSDPKYHQLDAHRSSGPQDGCGRARRHRRPRRPRGHHGRRLRNAGQRPAGARPAGDPHPGRQHGRPLRGQRARPSAPASAPTSSRARCSACRASSPTPGPSPPPRPPP